MLATTVYEANSLTLSILSNSDTRANLSTFSDTQRLIADKGACCRGSIHMRPFLLVNDACGLRILDVAVPVGGNSESVV